MIWVMSLYWRVNDDVWISSDLELILGTVVMFINCRRVPLSLSLSNVDNLLDLRKDWYFLLVSLFKHAALFYLILALVLWWDVCFLESEVQLWLERVSASKCVSRRRNQRSGSPTAAVFSFPSCAMRFIVPAAWLAFALVERSLAV